MSTTRWIIETPCEHDELIAHVWPIPSPIPFHLAHCPGGSRIVVDPANLPPEAIQRAAKVIARFYFFNEPDTEVAEAAIRAFLSDPEQGDQT